MSTAELFARSFDRFDLIQRHAERGAIQCWCGHAAGANFRGRRYDHRLQKLLCGVVSRDDGRQMMCGIIEGLSASDLAELRRTLATIYDNVQRGRSARSARGLRKC